MKEKKESTNWYIAVIHLLMSTVIGFIIMMVISFFIGLPLINFDKLTFHLISFYFITPVGFWFGIMYSAKYLNKKYIIKNAHELIRLSLIFMIILAGGYKLYQIITSGFGLGQLTSFVIALTIFYFASKKYIRNTNI